MNFPKTNKHLPKGLYIIYEDDAILVIDKPAGLLGVSSEKEKERTAYYALTDYVRKGCAKSNKRIFIVHRIDKDTSGVLVFAKSEKAKLFLQDHWKETRKKYLAVVHGKFKKKSDIITSYLTGSKALRVYSTPDKESGKLSRTAYRVIKETNNYSLLEIDLLTGRKHQIRVHMAEAGNPVAGDIKYGRHDPHCPRMALHALSISFKHPASRKQLTFRTDIPDIFQKLVGHIPSIDDL